MWRPRSISVRLALGFALLGTSGTVVLLISVLVEYGFTLSDLLHPRNDNPALHEVYEHVVLPVLIMAIPMAGGALWVIRTALKPLAGAAAAIEAARGRERGLRIRTGALPGEVAPFAEAVNGLLDRLDMAAEGQEAFAADIAHELRTPLAILSLELDRLDHPLAGRLKEDLLAMRRLIDQLMLLAQVEADEAAHRPQAGFSMGDLCTDVVTRLAPLVIAHGRQLEMVDESATSQISGRREAVGAALRNLVENALAATPVGGAVTVHCGPGPIIAVRDGGPGLSTERLAQLVKRHRRGDHAGPGGAGLGLAIVARIMASHGGTLETRPETCELRLCFPRQAGSI